MVNSSALSKAGSIRQAPDAARASTTSMDGARNRVVFRSRNHDLPLARRH